MFKYEPLLSKANFQNGWTVKAKQTRKRKPTTGENPKAKKGQENRKREEES